MAAEGIRQLTDQVQYFRIGCAKGDRRGWVAFKKIFGAMDDGAIFGHAEGKRERQVLLQPQHFCMSLAGDRNDLCQGLVGQGLGEPVRGFRRIAVMIQKGTIQIGEYQKMDRSPGHDRAIAFRPEPESANMATDRSIIFYPTRRSAKRSLPDRRLPWVRPRPAPGRNRRSNHPGLRRR